MESYGVMDASTDNILHMPEIGASKSVEEIPKKKDKGFKKWTKKLLKYFIYAVFTAYFAWATVYFIQNNGSFESTTCSGYGFLLILYCFYSYGFLYSVLLKPFIFPLVYRTIWTPLSKFLASIKYGSIIFYLSFLIAVVAYLVFDTNDNRSRLIPLSGLLIFLLLGWLISYERSKVPWHTVIWGVILQFLFGLLTIRWETGRNIFDCIGGKVTTFLNYAIDGSAFVYSDFLVKQKAVFAFSALSTIYFLCFIVNILYYYGIMQKVVSALGEFLQWVMGTSICESVNCSANIFFGQSEAPLLIKPYLRDLTDSEIHSIMCSGFATVSGSVLAAYISFGASASNLITASVMSAPAALCFSKLLYPETQEIKFKRGNIQSIDIEYESVMDAASRGAQDAFALVSGIASSLIAFVSFVYFINGVLGWFGILVGFSGDSLWTLELIMGKIFIPFSFVMGVPWEECELVGSLIGIKTMVNEFVAFQKMGQMDLQPRTKVIATYAICGFANPGSIGIMISTLGTLMPNKNEAVTRVAFRAFIGGSLVCFMTACIAGLLMPEDAIP